MKYYLVLLITVPLFAAFEKDRAAALAQKNEWQHAHELFKHAVCNEPHNATAVYDLGVSSYKMKEYDKALSYFTTAATMPDACAAVQEQAYFNAGNSHVALKQLPEAIGAYDQVLARNPNHERARHNKEIVKKMLEQQKQQEKKEQEQQQKNNNNSKDQQQNGKNEKENNRDNQPSNNDKKSDNDSQKNKAESDQASSAPHKQPSDTQQPSPNADKQSESDTQKENPANTWPESCQKDKNDARASTSAVNKQKPSSPDSPGTAGIQQESSEQHHAQPKLSPGLARILENQEKKDEQLNKQIVKALATERGGSTYDYHCW